MHGQQAGATRARGAGALRAGCMAAALVAGGLAGAALADAPGRDAVAGTLYSTAAAAYEIRLYDGGALSAEERDVLLQVGGSQPWFAALAFAPDAGLLAEPSTLAANHHGLEAARSAALSACEEKRSGGAACRVVMEITPRGFAPGGPELSRAATEAFAGEYRRARAPRAFAISPSTGEWGLAGGAGSLAEARAAALAACAARDSAPDDCRVMSED